MIATVFYNMILNGSLFLSCGNKIVFGYDFQVFHQKPTC